jgi:hypothetical protein
MNASSLVTFALLPLLAATIRPTETRTYRFTARVQKNGGVTPFQVGSIITGSFTYDMQALNLVKDGLPYGQYRSPRNRFSFQCDGYSFTGTGVIEVTTGLFPYAEHFGIVAFDLELPPGWKMRHNGESHAYSLLLQNAPPRGAVRDVKIPKEVKIKNFISTREVRLTFGHGIRFPGGQVKGEAIVFAKVESLELPFGETQVADDARAIIEKAIKAQGGEANLSKLRTMQIKVEGTVDVMPGQPRVPMTIEDTWQMPVRYKTFSTLQMFGMKVSQALVLDGNKAWLQMESQVFDMPSQGVTEMKEQKYAEDLDRLSFLSDKRMDLSVLPEVNVQGKAAVGVLVKCKGHRDVKLYFDKATGLLVKREHKLLNPATGKETLQEVLFGDYQEKDGLKHYKKITAFRDGKNFFDGRVTELQFFDKLDDKVFTKP